jgi:diguanylate cyclase (GGDEF)-like protein/PAS domain S-box-containing protein
VVGARQRFRFVLDAGTVILSGLSLIWATSVHQTGDLATALITGGMLMAVVFAGFKVQNSGNAPLTGLALVLCMLATGLQALAMLLTWLSGSVPAALTALSVLPNFLIPLGLRFQQLNSSRHRPVGPARRDRFRVALWLPWAAVAVAGAALVLTLVGRGDLNTWGTVIVVLVLAAVVVARQVDALIDSTKLAENLQGKERWVNELLRHSTDVTAVMNKAGVITWVSPGIRAILGRSQETIVGMDSAKIIHPDDIAEFGRLVSQVFGQPGETASLTARVQHGDQSWRWMEVTMTNLLDDPVVQGLVCNGRDVTDARGLQERLRHEATHDPLTSLPNRALFAERLGAVAGATAALLLIDLDGFKAVNDTHGHHAGDALLVAIAERLRRCVRPGDTPARLGGDEFAVVLPAAGRSDAEHVAARLTALLTDPVALDGVLVPLRASIGIATSDAVDPDQLLREADSAMYATKRAQKHDGRRALAG